MLSTVWLTDSLIIRAAIVGTWQIRSASSTVRSARSSSGKIFDTMPSWCASSTEIESPVSMSSLVLRGPNSHGCAQYYMQHMPRRVPTTHAEVVSPAATITLQAHNSLSPHENKG